VLALVVVGDQMFQRKKRLFVEKAKEINKGRKMMLKEQTLLSK
jgi:hypothetical protein